MTITSKLVVRTLVVLIGLFIFVRGLWIFFTYSSPLNFVDVVNAAFSSLVCLVTIAIAFVMLAATLGYMFREYVQPFITDLRTGEKQLFKPFKINFKFKKKHD